MLFLPCADPLELRGVQAGEGEAEEAAGLRGGLGRPLPGHRDVRRQPRQVLGLQPGPRGAHGQRGALREAAPPLHHQRGGPAERGGGDGQRGRAALHVAGLQAGQGEGGARQRPEERAPRRHDLAGRDPVPAAAERRPDPAERRGGRAGGKTI